MIWSSSTDSASIASHLHAFTNLNRVTARGDHQGKKQNPVLVLDHSVGNNEGPTT